MGAIEITATLKSTKLEYSLKGVDSQALETQQKVGYLTFSCKIK